MAGGAGGLGGMMRNDETRSIEDRQTGTRAGSVRALVGRLVPRGGDDPDGARRLRRRRIAVGLFCAAMILLTGRAVLGPRGMVAVGRQRAEEGRLRKEVEAARLRNEALKAEIVELRTGHAAIERLARERLDYIMPGEVTFLFPEGSSLPPARDPSH